MEQEQKESLFVLELPLKVEKWQADRLNVRYELMRRMYNYALRILLHQFQYHIKSKKDFCSCKKIQEKKNYIKNHPINIKDITDKKGSPLDITFSEYGIGGFVAQLVKRDVGSGNTYKDFGINSSYADCVASNLWAAWDKWLYTDKCKRISYKKKDSFNTISVRKKSGYFPGFSLSSKDWKEKERIYINININGRQKAKEEKITLPIEYNPDSEYERQALSLGYESIRVISIARKRIRGKYKYYLQLTLKGSAFPQGRALGAGKVGIDLGPSTIAVVSNSNACLKRLAPECDDIEKELGRLQRKMERSRRANNPQNYNEDGRIKSFDRSKGERIKWNYSHRYLLLRSRKAELQRKQAAIRKMSHIRRANKLLSFGNTFIVEDNPISSWSHRAKETKKSEKTGKYQRKKRFGHSIANHAPSMFITILKNKVHALGGQLIKVKLSNAASRFDFVSGEFAEHELNERKIKLSNGDLHQRDFIAAFNLQHLNLSAPQPKEYEIQEMRADYPHFCELERLELERILCKKDLHRGTIGAEKNIKEVLSSLVNDKLMPKGGWFTNAKGNETGKIAGSVLPHVSDDHVSGLQKASNLHYNEDDT